MNEFVKEARDELKRSDHLFYVSLKYSRTVDVLKNLLDRLITGCERCIDALLLDAEEKKQIFERPDNVGLKVKLVKKTVQEPWVEEMSDFMMFLRKINRAEFTRAREFRRHVTMTAIMDDGVVEVNIDIIKEYYDRVTDYVNKTDVFISGEPED